MAPVRGRGRPRRNARANNNEATGDAANVQLNERQRADMTNDFQRMLRDAIPMIVNEVNRANNNNRNDIGPEAGIAADDIIGGDHNHVEHIQNQVLVEEKYPRNCEYKTFKACNPPSFDGKKDAVSTFQWIHEMEAVIEISECREDQAVKFAAHSFVSEALYWWGIIKQARGTQVVAAMKWEEMKKLVLEQFCSQNELDKMEMNFMKLEAGNMTHREYTTKYNEMSRLVPDLVNTNEKRIRRYVQGLPSAIRKLIKPLAPKTFQSAVEISAGMYDEEYGEGGRPEGVKRKWEEFNEGGRKNEGRLKKKHKTGIKNNSCKKCGKTHGGECRQGSNRCYRCGRPDHFIQDCPKAKIGITCYNCGKIGHLSTECPERRKSITCFVCGEVGHTRTNCPKLIKNPEPLKMIPARGGQQPNTRGKAFALTNPNLKMEKISVSEIVKRGSDFKIR
ncbi:hypothetical protein E3N88_34260 [Mikania micrantha]|uniref:CCHC-type domain-containing protein n=1 Tax=Mikania micrantha TaxID=192012 RepID=A0A5N6LXK7_9ASTR|nr:hypothetical protein E3N88_34260 [Mikania micrantha]